MNETQIALALLPFLGVVVGAFLQYIFTARREKQNQKKQLEIKAYSDYLLAASESSSRDINTQITARVKLTDAKARIAIYGSEKVVKCIAEFDRHGSKLETPDDQKRFVKITKVMRDESKGDDVSLKDIAQLLFSSDLS